MNRHGVGMVLAITLAVAVVRPALLRAQVMDNKVYSLVLFDLLEYQHTGAENPVTWDMLWWIGGDFTRLWIKSEGARSTTVASGDVEVQALFSRLFAPFWEWQAGLRLDTRYGAGTDRTRVLAVVGLEGLAPYWFEVEPAVFVSHEGDISARVTTTYDMFVTQRLIAQPRIEVNAAVQDVPEFGVGSGLNDLDLGFRLRYEIRREYAPYVGISWLRRFAGTADLARLSGGAVSDLAAVGGLRVWF